MTPNYKAELHTKHEFTFLISYKVFEDREFFEWFVKKKLNEYCDKRNIKEWQDAIVGTNEDEEGRVKVTVIFYSVITN